MGESGFRYATAQEHEALFASEKKVALERIVGISLFMIVPIIILLMYFPITKPAPVKQVSQEELLAGFTETEDTIIEELYGDRIAYADQKTWHSKTDFVDKEKSAAAGEIIYDEEAYQAYYDSFLAEFDAQVDHQKVTNLLEERKAAYLAAKEATAQVSGFANPFWNGRTFFWTFALFALVMVNILHRIHKVNIVANRNYMVAEGTIVQKMSARNRINFIKPFAKVRLDNGETVKVHMSMLQSLAIGENARVMVARLNGRLLPFYSKYVFCKL